MERVRAVVIGAGFIGEVHARSVVRAGGTVVAVVASTPARSAAASARLGAERSFATASEAVTASDVDVVHICSPNQLHAPVALEALAAGKHVICEKPLGLDGVEAERMVRAARDAGRVGAVPFVYRYYPTVAEARERVLGGTTGPVRVLHGSYLQDWLLTVDDDNWRADVAVGGRSRAFADIGSHWCDLAAFITGDPIVRVMARMITTVPERRRTDGRHAFEHDVTGGEFVAIENEDAAIVLFETAAGAAGSVVISQVAAGRKNRLWIEIDGADEAIAFDQETPETLWCGRREAVTLVPRAAESLGAAAQPLITLPGGHPQGYGDCFAAFVADAYQAIRDGRSSAILPGFADGLAASRLTDAVIASNATREWVDVDGAPPSGLTTVGGNGRADGAASPSATERQ